jgi:hypothetical protein
MPSPSTIAREDEEDEQSAWTLAIAAMSTPTRTPRVGELYIEKRVSDDLFVVVIVEEVVEDFARHRKVSSRAVNRRHARFTVGEQSFLDSHVAWHPTLIP